MAFRFGIAVLECGAGPVRIVGAREQLMVSPTELDANHDMVGWQFDNTYWRLPEVFFAPAQPAKVRAPRLSILNHRLADELGLDFASVSPQSAAACFAGQDLP